MAAKRKIASAGEYTGLLKKKNASAPLWEYFVSRSDDTSGPFDMEKAVYLFLFRSYAIVLL